MDNGPRGDYRASISINAEEEIIARFLTHNNGSSPFNYCVTTRAMISPAFIVMGPVSVVIAFVGIVGPDPVMTTVSGPITVIITINAWQIIPRIVTQ